MNIFVGNMAREMKKDELHKIFSDFGEVDSVTVLIDRIQGEWKAFGFVDMPNVEQAKEAISNLNGREYLGKKLQVHEARYRTRDRRTNGRKGGRRYTDQPEYQPVK